MYASKLELIKPFQVMEVLARAAQLEAQGHNVVHLQVGEPDFPTAEPIIAAAQQALVDGKTKYTQATGIAPLREAISQHYQRLGVAVTPERIVITSGASAGLTLLAALLLNPGDELLITDPGYPCNEVFVHLVGATPTALPVAASQHFQPTARQIDAAWGQHTRGALLASPANPTGTMLGATELTEIAAVIQARGGVLILDEIYQGLADQAAYATGLALVDELFVLNSFSKYFGMTGWRLGWVVLPESAIAGATSLAQNLFICPSAPAQYAALAAFSPAALAIHEQRAARFRQRCKRLCAGLQDLGFAIPVYPDGAFYLYVDVSHTGLSSAEFCLRLLNEYHVATTPGADFGSHHSDTYVRFAYTTSEAQIELALQRLEAALTAWGVRP